MRYLKVFCITLIVSLLFLGGALYEVQAGSCIIGGGGWGDAGVMDAMDCTNCDPPKRVDVCRGEGTGCHYQGIWNCPTGGFIPPTGDY